jgi:hypothetical protein
MALALRRPRRSKPTIASGSRRPNEENRSRLIAFQQILSLGRAR